MDHGGEALARVEHARLHGVGRNVQKLGDLGDGFALVVDEIDDFPMLGGKRIDRAAQERGALLAGELALGIGCRVDDIERNLVVELLGAPRCERRQRLVPSDPEELGRDARAAREHIGAQPHVEEHVVQQVLGERPVAHHAQDEAKDAVLVAVEQHAHRPAVGHADGLHQGVIRHERVAAWPRRAGPNVGVERPGDGLGRK
jgi:hypothetical protein